MNDERGEISLAGGGESGPAQHVLVVRSGTWLCAIPLTEVRETMRRLPIRPVTGSPPFVRGIALVRGSYIPVIDLRILLGESDEHEQNTCHFFVTVQFGDQRAALETDAVIGAQHIPLSVLDPLPSLLSEAMSTFVEKLGSLNQKHLAFCSTVKLLSSLASLNLEAQRP